jgi:hypothetical protein
MARRAITDQDRTKAKQLLLGWLADDNDDIDKVTSAAFDLHVQHNTFPGEEFMRLAADALEVAGIDRADPIEYEALLADHLPEIEFRGKQYRKIRFAVMSSAGLRGGLDPDLLDEVAYWNDDYWRYALFAAIALIRASVDKTGGSVADLARRVAALHVVDLGDPESGEARPG